MAQTCHEVAHYDAARPFLDQSCIQHMSAPLTKVFDCLEVDLAEEGQSELNILASSVEDWWISQIEGNGYTHITAGEKATSISDHALLIMTMRGVDHALGEHSLLPGEITLAPWDSEETITSFGSFAYMCVYVPRHYINAIGMENIPFGQSINTDSGRGAVLAATMSSLVHGILAQESSDELKTLLPAFTDFALATFSDPTAAARHELRQSRKMRRIVSFLTENFENAELCPEQVACQLGMSRRQLCREFQQIGETYSTYLNSLRLEHARQQLRDRPGRPISHIAFDVGFNSPTVFGRKFKNIYGLTPREFVRNTVK